MCGSGLRSSVAGRKEFSQMAEQATVAEPARSLREKAVFEFKRFVAVFLYLWVVFALLSIHETIIRAQHHLDYRAHTFAVINAFVFAKVLLVGDYLRLGNRFKHKPLIYPVLYKCLVFSALLTGFHVVERTFSGVIGGKTFSESFFEIGGRTLISIVLISALAFVMLIPFFAFRELGKMIGEKELRELFLGRGEKTEVGMGSINDARVTEEQKLAK
jgi:hypothetical protein